MEFHNEFVLDIPAGDLFAVLADIERIAPCMPGAQVEGRDGDTYRGSMRVKVGPVVAEYRGTFAFDELDASTRRAVINARADETGGQGGAEATIRAAVVEEETGSRVAIDTEVQVRGRVAQLGRGPMERIAKKMIAQFADNLQKQLRGDEPSPSAAAAPVAVGTSDAGTPPGPAAAVTPPAPRPAEPLNGLSLVGDLVPDFMRRDALTLGLAFACGYLLGQLRARRG